MSLFKRTMDEMYGVGNWGHDPRTGQFVRGISEQLPLLQTCINCHDTGYINIKMFSAPGKRARKNPIIVQQPCKAHGCKAYEKSKLRPAR